MVGARSMKALVGALLVMMLASIAGGFATASTAQTSTEAASACGVDFAALLESAVNSAIYTLIELNVSRNSESWSLVMDANASVGAIAQAQASGQCTTALELYLNATKKIAEAISEAKKESSESAELLEEQAKIMAEIRAEIKAAIKLRNEIREAFEQGRINETVKVQLEARVNASIQAMIQLEVKINASIQAGNLTVQVIHEFKAQLDQIKEELRSIAKALDEEIADSYKEEIEERVKSKVEEAIKELQELKQKLQEHGVCDALPNLCNAIDQSIQQLMNLTMVINQSMNENMTAFTAMVMAIHAEKAAEGVLDAVDDIDVEVNVSIEVYQAYMNASEKLDELKQALIDLRDTMASKHMPTQQMDLMINKVDDLKEELREMVSHSHEEHEDERSSMARDAMEFFSGLKMYMMQLNETMGMDQEMKTKIDAVMTKLVEAEAAVNATMNMTMNVSATFNETCKSKAKALLERSVKAAESAMKTLDALEMEDQANAVEQAVEKLEAAIEAVEHGDNVTAIQEIDAAVSILVNVQAQISGENSAYASISAKISVSIELALSAKAELQ